MSEPFGYGQFDIVLANYLKVHGISKNQLSDNANLQRTKFNSYRTMISGCSILIIL